jgi:hypothetical protein
LGETENREVRQITERWDRQQRGETDNRGVRQTTEG